MKIALLGYGKMNRLVERLAGEAGHEIGCVVRSTETDARPLVVRLKGCDVAIDFSIAEVVPEHARACSRAGVPLVEGTTGWLNRKTEIEEIVEQHGGLMIYGANFSVGVNVFYRLVRCAAEMLRDAADYDCFIEEAHHRAKRDAPSGTALHLQTLLRSSSREDAPIASTRAGFIPGTHRVGFDSAIDTITLQHTARSREGFARGALHAADYLTKLDGGARGIYEFSSIVLDIIAPDPVRR